MEYFYQYIGYYQLILKCYFYYKNDNGDDQNMSEAIFYDRITKQE